MAYKKPVVIRALISELDPTKEILDYAYDMFTILANGFNSYVGDNALAEVKDYLKDGTRVVDLVLSLPACDYAWVYSANKVNDTTFRYYISHINKNTNELIINFTYSTYDKSYAISRNLPTVLYAISSEDSFFTNLVFNSTIPITDDTIELSASYVYGITTTENNRHILTYNTLMGGYLEGTTNIYNATTAQVITRKPGTCVVRKVLYSNGEVLKDVLFLASARGLASIRDWYIYLKNSGVYFNIATTVCNSIFRINEDARSVR